MPTDSERKAIQKYDREKVDRIIFRVPKGQKEIIQAHAESHGESLAGFIYRAIKETIERDQS